MSVTKITSTMQQAEFRKERICASTGNLMNTRNAGIGGNNDVKAIKEANRVLARFAEFTATTGSLVRKDAGNIVEMASAWEKIDKEVARKLL